MENVGNGRSANARFALVCAEGAWQVVCDGEPHRLPDVKGVRYLALLLARPGVRLHVLEMVARVGETGSHRGAPSGLEGQDLRDGIDEATVDRVRKRVAIAVRRARDGIGRRCPELGEHLRRRIRLGRWCEYHAERSSAVRFECRRTRRLASAAVILHKGT